MLDLTPSNVGLEGLQPINMKILGHAPIDDLNWEALGAPNFLGFNVPLQTPFIAFLLVDFRKFQKIVILCLSIFFEKFLKIFQLVQN